MSNDASSVCGSSVLIVNVMPVRPAIGPGGWPIFRSLWSLRSVRFVPSVDTESIARSWPPPGYWLLGAEPGPGSGRRRWC